MRISLLLSLSFALTALPLVAAERTPVANAAIEQSVKEPTITINNATVRINNAEGERLEVYNLAGVKVAIVRIDSPAQTINLDHLPKGCYILRVGQIARKVYIR